MAGQARADAATARITVVGNGQGTSDNLALLHATGRTQIYSHRGKR
jgi:hypothetical protein